MIRLGASCDWSRERFTLDPGLSRAVREVFVRLYEKGLVYRGEYMVNWCPRCHTALSDLEVAHTDVAGHLWHIRYPVNGMPGRFVTVATTRPETMLGDTAIAINAKDARYFELHAKTVQLPIMDREISIILDDLADPEFGTGVVKVTPAHDLNDFEAGRRHNLPKIKVIDENARMTDAAGPYSRGRRTRKDRRAGESGGLQTQPRNVPTLQNAGGTAGLHAMVRQDEAAGRKGHRSGRKRPHRIHSGQLDQDLLRVDVQHPRLVHFAPALVGPSHPRVALPGVS
jgi:isoleucyl-tRNA synthetase